jgi:hypothetical protein
VLPKERKQKKKKKKSLLNIHSGIFFQSLESTDSFVFRGRVVWIATGSVSIGGSGPGHGSGEP